MGLWRTFPMYVRPRAEDSLQQQVVRPVRVELEHLLPTPSYPLHGQGHEAEDELLEPEGGLYKVQSFGHMGNDEMVEVTADCGHYKEHRVLFQKGEGHPLPQKVVVHLVEEPLAVPTCIVEADHFEVVHIGVVGDDRPVGKTVPGKEVALPVVPFFPAYHIAIGLFPAKGHILDGGDPVTLVADLDLLPLRYVPYRTVEGGAALGPYVGIGAVGFHGIRPPPW